MTEEQKRSYALDNNNEGWIVGWAVIQNSPWVLAGMFLTKEEAAATQSKLGDSYEVRYGSRRLGSDDFVGS